MKHILWFDWEEKIKSCLRKVANSADKKVRSTKLRRDLSYPPHSKQSRTESAEPVPDESDVPPLVIVVNPHEPDDTDRDKSDRARLPPAEMHGSINYQEASAVHYPPEREEKRALERDDTRPHHPLCAYRTAKETKSNFVLATSSKVSRILLWVPLLDRDAPFCACLSSVFRAVCAYG